MATVTLFPIALTSTPPRVSPSVSYSGSGHALFRLTAAALTDWTAADPALVVTFDIEQSFDGGSTWSPMCPASWSPPTLMKDGGLPALQCTAGDVLGGRLLRAQLSATASISIGINATVA